MYLFQTQKSFCPWPLPVMKEGGYFSMSKESFQRDSTSFNVPFMKGIYHFFRDQGSQETEAQSEPQLTLQGSHKT